MGYLLILNSIYLINLILQSIFAEKNPQKTLVFEYLNKILKSILE